MEVKKAVRIGANPVFTRRRVVALTLAALLPYRPYWTPRQGGFEVTLSGIRQDWNRWSQVLQLVSSACVFGGWRHFLVCPQCGHRAMALYQTGDGFACRGCAGLRYVSKTVSDDLRLMHHFADLADALEHRPGPNPRRYFRYASRENLHGTRGLRRVSEKLTRWTARLNRERRR